MARRGIWTPANVVTCIRVALVPLWLLVAQLTGFSGAVVGHNPWGYVTFVLFVALSLTDKLDGHLARSRNEVTTFGKFLDPIADKLLVITGMLWLLQAGLVSMWALLLVVAREFLVSGLRMVVASRGVVVAASSLGKWKTATTMVSLCGYLLVRALPLSGLSIVLLGFSHICFAVAMVLTAWSGIDYFMKAWPYLSASEEDTDGRA